MGRAVGIDLGTTFSAVAVAREAGNPQIVPNREGERITPSVVLFQGDTAVVGSQAKRSVATAPRDVVQFVKRRMGERNVLYTSATSRDYYPEEISALILKRLKEDAELHLGEPVDRAVITVPAYFDDARRKATRDAGTIAGLEVLRILNEPTAAALAYGVDHEDAGNILVYDLGGGTFDVTIMKASDGILEVLATDGDRNLGGFDWDNALMVHLNERFMAAGGPDLTEDDALAAELRDKAEIAKRTLSMTEQTTVVLSAGGVHEQIKVTREEFEKLTDKLLARTRLLVEQALADAALDWPDIDRILLVGGSTRMPMVQRLLEEMSGRRPEHGIAQDEVVALGAAVLAAAIESGEESPDGGDDVGAAQEAGLARVTRGAVGRIEDVTSQSLGIIAYHSTDENSRHNTIIIKRNTRIPASETGRYTTLFDKQAAFKVEVTEGDDEDPEFVTIIGSSTIDIPEPPRPQGYPMDVTLSYDIDAIIHVEVKDGRSGESWGEFEVERKANMDESEVRTAARRMSDHELF